MLRWRSAHISARMRLAVPLAISFEERASLGKLADCFWVDSSFVWASQVARRN